MLYIYTHTQNSIFGVSEKERFLDRCSNYLWNDVGKVFGKVLESCFIDCLMRVKDMM